MDFFFGKGVEYGSGVINFGNNMQNLKRKLEELESIEADVDAQLKTTTKKRKREVENWLKNVVRIKNEVQRIEQQTAGSSSIGKGLTMMGGEVEKLTKEVEELNGKGGFEGGLVLDVHEYSAEAWPAPELVGPEFQRNKGMILEFLMEENVSIVGVYGMGGSGKTTLVKHIHNELLKRVDDFGYIYWITVSQDFTIFRLQNLIANAIGLKDFKEKDEGKRAAELFRALQQKQKCVLILDDLWNHFSLEKVRIPIGADRCKCKVILTSRSLDVCRRIGCNEKVRVNTLCEGDAWKLFLQILWEPLPSNITEIAKSITRECDGLPLGIKTIAGSMRGVDDVCEWRHALKNLQDSKAELVDEEDEVFKVLKFSYDRVSDLKLQKCFLYCALFPEDHRINRRELIEHLIDEELIVGESRAVKFDEGHTILNRLERVCLLEGGEIYTERCVKMHDLIRDMAIKIMQTDQIALVEAGKQLTEVPKKEKWTENIRWCSLMQNNIEDIPPGYSPRCPKLSTLLLSDNESMFSISASFFKHLNGLKMLDLSCTNIDELPCSYLKNLSALLLRRCESLHRLPSLKKLQALKKLDLGYTGILEVPEGIEFLLELRYLDLEGTGIYYIPSGILSKLSNLQFLNLGCNTIAAEDLAKLDKLEHLVFGIRDVSEFNAYTFPANPMHFVIFVGKVYEPSFGEAMMNIMHRENVKVVWIDSCKINSVGIHLPRNVEELSIKRCPSETNDLCLQNVTELKQFIIEECKGAVSLSSTDSFQSLESITIWEMEDLEFIFSREAMIPQSPPLSTFPLLREIDISGCPRIKQLFPLALLSNLQSLERIDVWNCDRMEELIATEEEEEEVGSPHTSIEFTLPKLKCLKLLGLPELKSIRCRRLICNSIKEIVVADCPKLKQIPISLISTENEGRPYPLPSLQRIYVYPPESWESFEFEHPNAKDFLFPLCKFPLNYCACFLLED